MAYTPGNTIIIPNTYATGMALIVPGPNDLVVNSTYNSSNDFIITRATAFPTITGNIATTNNNDTVIIDTTNAFVTQQLVEVMHSGSAVPNVDVTQQLVEVTHSSTAVPNVDVTQQLVEVMRSRYNMAMSAYPPMNFNSLTSEAPYINTVVNLMSITGTVATTNHNDTVLIDALDIINIKLTQQNVEVAHSSTVIADILVSKQLTEIAFSSLAVPNINLTQQGLEVAFISDAQPNIRMTQQYVEVMRSRNTFVVPVPQTSFNNLNTISDYINGWETMTYILPPRPLATMRSIPTYFMRAWDSGNIEYVYWETQTPDVMPVTTTPAMSSKANLSEIAFVHKE